MLNWMHREAREGFNVGVSVMEAVDVFVHGRNMDKSSGKKPLIQN